MDIFELTPISLAVIVSICVVVFMMLREYNDMKLRSMEMERRLEQRKLDKANDNTNNTFSDSDLPSVLNIMSRLFTHVKNTDISNVDDMNCFKLKPSDDGLVFSRSRYKQSSTKEESEREKKTTETTSKWLAGTPLTLTNILKFMSNFPSVADHDRRLQDEPLPNMIRIMYSNLNDPCSTVEEAIATVTYLQERLPSEQYNAFIRSFLNTNDHGVDTTVALYKKRNNYSGLSDYLKRVVLSSPYHMLIFYKDCDHVKVVLERWISSERDDITDFKNFKIMASLVLGYVVE